MNPDMYHMLGDMFSCCQVTKLIDYEQFCGSSATDKDGEVVLLTPDERVTARQLAEVAGRNLTES